MVKHYLKVCFADLRGEGDKYFDYFCVLEGHY